MRHNLLSRSLLHSVRKQCFLFLFFLKLSLLLFLHLRCLCFSQVNFSSSLDTGSGSGSGGTAGCQSPLPLVTLSPIIHPRIREFRSGLSSARKGGPPPPCSTRGSGAVLMAPLFSRCASFSTVRPRPLQLPGSWQR